MRKAFTRIKEGFGLYQFEIRHLTVLFIILIIFQIVVSFVHKISLQKILLGTQEWYQQDSAERLANLTTTSLELLLESRSKNEDLTPYQVNKIVQDLNIILSQQYLNQNVQEICLLVPIDTAVVAIDDGHALFDYIFNEARRLPPSTWDHSEAIRLYSRVKDEFRAKEQIQSIVDQDQSFHLFVPFVPRGEFAGAVYMKNRPDFSVITNEMISTYDETAITYSALILFGLLAMFYISSYTLKERNKAQHLLFEEQKRHLAEQISIQNELLFTKRIYHTHHKAEKVMGFIKEDLRRLNAQTIDSVSMRITKYASFIARVIYDMKWYDPPVQTIRSHIFHTDLNAVVTFLVDNVFKRISLESSEVQFALHLADTVPAVHINEFVVWEVFEPIIQNCLDHAGDRRLVITIATAYDAASRLTTVSVSDNGKGIEPWLLERDPSGRKKIFLEHTSTKEAGGGKHSGYGCYISYEIARQRCGWDLDAANLPGGGCRFTFTIPND